MSSGFSKDGNVLLASQSNLVWEPLKHIPALDGVRGLAILMVTLYRFGKEGLVGGETGGLVAKVIQLGSLGVDLFFVLSGFLITGILIDTKSQSNFFARFFARRSLRIFPLYFVSLTLFLFVVPWFYGGQHPFQQAKENQSFLWTYLTNVKMSLDDSWCFGYLDHYWSLAVEEHFYLIWPLIVFWLPPKRLLIGCGILASLSALSRIVFAIAFENGVAPDVLTVFRCDGLLLGACVATALRDRMIVPRLRRYALRGFPIFLLVGLLLMLSERKFYTIPHTVMALLWASGLSILVTSIRGAALSRWFELPFLRILGKYSYAMYIFQSPLIPLSAGIISVEKLQSIVSSQFVAAILYVAIMSLFTFCIAIISWNCLEKHFLKWRPFQNKVV